MTTSLISAAVWYAVLSGCGGSSGQGTGTGPDGGSQSGGGTAQSAPIPTTSFVFESDPVKGQPKIFAYDTATATVTRIADLDGDVTIDGLALSHDRRSMAFTGVFRPESSEAQLGYLVDSVWTVQTDGTTFRRVTPPLPPMTPPGPQYRITMFQPAWSPDGATIYVEHGEAWQSGTTRVAGTAIWQIAASGGLPGPSTALKSTCTISGNFAFSLDGSTAAFTRASCSPSTGNGVFLVRGDTVTRLAQFESTVGDSVDGLSWTADGSVMISDVNGLDVIAAPSGPVTATIPSPAQGDIVEAIAADPTGRYVAACVLRPGLVKSLWLLDLSKAPPAWTQLQVPLGHDCWVSW